MFTRNALEAQSFASGSLSIPPPSPMSSSVGFAHVQTRMETFGLWQRVWQRRLSAHSRTLYHAELLQDNVRKADYRLGFRVKDDLVGVTGMAVGR